MEIILTFSFALVCEKDEKLIETAGFVDATFEFHKLQAVIDALEVWVEFINTLLTMTFFTLLSASMPNVCGDCGV